LNSDIAGAQSFGYQTALMLTGVTYREKLLQSEYTPDMVFEGV